MAKANSRTRGARASRPTGSQPPPTTVARLETPGDTTATRHEETTMQDQANAHEVFTQATGKGLEAMTFWAEANQRVLRELVDLSAGTAKESLRLCTELQQSALDALREGQATAVRWQSGWQEAPKDPAQWYQKAMAETVEGTQRWFQLLEGQAQAVTRSAERLQASAEQAGKGIQQTFGEFVTRTKEIYARG